MIKLRLVCELDYDENIMHSSDVESINWFVENILKGDNLLLHDNGDIGDAIGNIKVLELGAVGAKPPTPKPHNKKLLEDKLNGGSQDE